MATSPASWVRPSAFSAPGTFRIAPARSQGAARDARRDGWALFGAIEELADVVVRKEALRVVAGHDHRADPIVGLGSRHKLVERADEGIVEEGVGRVRQRGEENAATLLGADRAAHLVDPLHCEACDGAGQRSGCRRREGLLGRFSRPGRRRWSRPT